ncbi:hypothetical protein LX36DRAFT_651204 [Colletotrichum falcatum]|nr:hypothetical protein LX36DRAFT_651204 [Colletotrichum falcatum]
MNLTLLFTHGGGRLGAEAGSCRLAAAIAVAPAAAAAAATFAFAFADPELPSKELAGGGKGREGTGTGQMGIMRGRVLSGREDKNTRT